MYVFDFGCGFSVGDNIPLCVGDTTKLRLSLFPPCIFKVGFFISDIGFEE